MTKSLIVLNMYKDWINKSHDYMCDEIGSEGWLTWQTEDIAVCLGGFTFIRFDRDTERTGESIGGGPCMAVNYRWATNFTVRERHCSRHYEIMTVSFRPHYLPREFI